MKSTCFLIIALSMIASAQENTIMGYSWPSQSDVGKVVSEVGCVTALSPNACFFKGTDCCFNWQVF